MQFTFERSAAVAALGRISGVVERRSTIPIMSHALLTAGVDGLTIQATDLDMEIACRVDADVSEGGSATADAKTLYDAANSCSSDASISVHLNGRLAVKSGRAKFNLATLPAGDFPTIGGDVWPTEFAIAAPVLRALLQSTAFAAAKNESWYVLNGVHLAPDGHELVAVATNRKRLATCALPAPKAAEKLKPVTLSRKTVDTLLRLIANRETEILFRASDFKVSFKADDFEMTSKVLDGDYFDWRKAIQRTAPNVARVMREELLQAIKRATIGTTVDADGIGIKVNLSDGKLTVAGRGQDSDAADEIGTDYAGADKSLGFQSGFLIDALSALTGEMVLLQFGDAVHSPLILTDPDEPSILMNIGQRVVGT